jgi:hypothetical protein
VLGERSYLREEGDEPLKRHLVVRMSTVRHTHDALLVAQLVEMHLVIVGEAGDDRRTVIQLTLDETLFAHLAGNHYRKSPNN